MAYKRKNSEYRELQRTSLYMTWSSMKSRCDNTNNGSYNRYGGRGIKYNSTWSDFANFYSDMKDSHFVGSSLDRINNDGNYCKENCRWATKKQQANNRRTNHKVEWNGETMNLSEWSEKLGIKSSTLRQRFYTYGWSIERCLTHKTP